MGRSPLCAVTCDGQHLHPGLVARACGASERKLFGETARLLRAESVGSVRGHMRRPTPAVRSGCPGLQGLWRKLHWRNSETTARRGGRLGARFYATANTFTPGFRGRSGLEGLWGKLHWRKARPRTQPLFKLVGRLGEAESALCGRRATTDNCASSSSIGLGIAVPAKGEQRRSTAVLHIVSICSTIPLVAHLSSVSQRAHENLLYPFCRNNFWRCASTSSTIN